jgi:hypothetical protein
VRATILLPLAMTACESYVATNGHTFTRSAVHSSFDPWPAALVASAAHDLDCPSRNLRVVADYREHAELVRESGGFRFQPPLAAPLGAVEGCGARATYFVIDGRLVMSSITKRTE